MAELGFEPRQFDPGVDVYNYFAKLPFNRISTISTNAKQEKSPPSRERRSREGMKQEVRRMQYENGFSWNVDFG